MAQVTLNVAGTQATGTSATTVSYTGITVGNGDNRALVVDISFLADPGALTVFRWDDGASNQNLSIIRQDTDADGHVVILMGLINPIPGNKTLKVTWTNSTEYAINAISWNNVDQTGANPLFLSTSFPNDSVATGNSTLSSITITIPPNGAGVSNVAGGFGGAIGPVSATQLYLVHGVGSVEMGGSYSTSNGTFTATWAPANPWVINATAIAPFYPKPVSSKSVKRVPWQQRMVKC